MTPLKGPISEGISKYLTDCSLVAVFDGSGNALAGEDAGIPTSEYAKLKELFSGTREEAITKSMVINGVRHEIHQYHPPLIYGRQMGVAPEWAVGAALCHVEASRYGPPLYVVVTFELPALTARIVPKLRDFCRECLAAS